MRVRVAGQVRAPGEIELGGLVRHTHEVTFECGRAGIRRHVFSGPLLIDALALAEPVFADRKDRLRYLVSARAADGHRTVLSWGELDPEFGNAPVLLGLTMDGRDLAEPHLVVPGDRCGARSVSDLTEVRLYPETAA